MAGQTPPPVEAQDAGADVTAVPRTAKERIFGALGGVLSAGSGRDTSKVQDAVAAHYNNRLNQAKMHRKNAATYAAILHTGVNPETGAPLTPEEKQQYQDWYNASWDAYAKIAGVSKETKGALQKGKAILEHVIGSGPGGQPQAPAATPQGQTGKMTPPPDAAGGDDKKKSMTPPPGPSTLDQAGLNAPQAAAGLQRNQDFNDFSRVQNLLHKLKMEEIEAQQRAKAAGGATPRPVHSGSVSVLDARKMSTAGQIFKNEQGEPIDVNQLDPSMGLYGIIRKNTDQDDPDFGKWETVYQPFSPNQRTITVGNVTYAVSPMDIDKLAPGNPPPGQPPGAPAGKRLGQHIVPKKGTHDVITIGPGGEPVPSTLGSTSTPSAPGIPGRTESPAGAAGGPTPPPGAEAAPSSPGGPGTAAPAATPTPKPAPRPAAAGGGPAGGIRGLPPGTYNQLLQRVTPVRLAATQLFGDPQNPNFKPLASYADVVNNPPGRDRVAAAWNLIRDHMDRAGVNENSHGDIVNIMRNYVGTPGAVAESEVAKMQETLDALKPREAELLNRLFSTYGTVIGLRSLTKGSAAKFSARNMEQEVPIPGMNVRNPKQFYDKLSVLAEEVNNGWKGVPEMMLTKGEREFDLKAQEDLAQKAKTGYHRKGMTPPPGEAGPKTADDYLKKHGG